MTKQKEKNKKGFYDYLELTAKKSKTILKIGVLFLPAIVSRVIEDKGNNKSKF